MLDMVPEDVRRQAREVTAAGPDPPEELGIRRITTPRYVVMSTPMPSVTFVDRLRLEGVELGAAVAEVRGVVRDLGRTQATWLVSGAATPAGLVDALLELGFVPHAGAPLQPIATCMAIVRPPDSKPAPGVEIRLADSVELMIEAHEVESAAFGMSGPDADALRATIPVRMRLQENDAIPVRQWVAYLNGKPVGTARGSLFEQGINLSGASVLPEARGHGIYRALIAQRWEEAVERGTPALTVQAGTMSAPILAKLGFIEVDRAHCLLDRLA